MSTLTGMKKTLMKPRFYVKADAINAVYIVGDIIEDENQDIISQDEFENRLDDLGENEVICTFVELFDPAQEEFFENLRKNYLVRKLTIKGFAEITDENLAARPI